MKQNMISSSANITLPTIAQDYQRGWEIAQKEYLRQQKQEQRQRNNSWGINRFRFKNCPVTEQVIRPVLEQPSGL